MLTPKSTADIWNAAQTREERASESSLPESVQWLNSLLASVWPLINPDLFTSLADTVEDVMQASLPKLVRMISVSDLGQGNGKQFPELLYPNPA